jgi:hypothetical protein
MIKLGSLSRQTPKSWRMCSCLKLLISWASFKNSAFSCSVAPFRNVCRKQSQEKLCYHTLQIHFWNNYQYKTFEFYLLTIWYSNKWTVRQCTCIILWQVCLAIVAMGTQQYVVFFLVIHVPVKNIKMFSFAIEMCTVVKLQNIVYCC